MQPQDPTKHEVTGFASSTAVPSRSAWRRAIVPMAAILLLAATLGAGVEPQDAGGTSSDGPAGLVTVGPYALESLVTEHGGEVHVRVRITRSDSNDPAGDLDVLVVATDRYGARSEWRTTQDSADRYSADLTLAVEGFTSLTIEIRGPAGDASVSIGSVERSSAGSRAGSVVLGIIVLGFVATGAWLWRSSRRALRAQNTA